MFCCEFCIIFKNAFFYRIIPMATSVCTCTCSFFFCFFFFLHVFVYTNTTFFYIIPDFGVSTTILYTIDISRRWCKLNFRPLRYQVTSGYFSARIDARRQYFCLLYKFLVIICKKRLGQHFWLMILIYYLLNGIRLDSNLGNSCWIRKILNFASGNINIWCFKHHI